MAATVHSHLSHARPDQPAIIPGGLVPPPPAPDGAADAYAEFHTVGRLPASLFDDHPPAADAAPSWHTKGPPGPITHTERRAVDDFQSSFKVVRYLLHAPIPHSCLHALPPARPFVAGSG